MDSLDLTAACVRSAIAIAAGFAICKWFRSGRERVYIWWSVVVASVLSFLPVQPRSIAWPVHFDPLPSEVVEKGRDYSAYRVDNGDASLLSQPLVIVLAVGVVLFAVRMFWTWRHLRSAEQVADVGVLDDVAEIASAVGTRDFPIVLASDHTDSAYAAGLLNPTIVLPRKSLDESGEERRALVCHEMLHIKKKDLWFVTLIDLWFCLFFWNPVAWLGRNLAFHAMEEVNDERTMSSGIVQKSTYLRALLNGNHPMVTAPIARFHGQNSLRARIEAIVKGETRRLSPWTIAACAAILMLAYPVKVESMPVIDEPGELAQDGPRDRIQVEELLYGSAVVGRPMPMRMRRDGAHNRPLFQYGGNGGGQVVPSPDGTKIAFIRGNLKNYDIYMSDLDGTNEILVAGRSDTEVQPHFSPDGTKIVYSARRKNRWQIFVYTIANRATKQVSDPNFREYEARWHPNSQRLIFSSDRNGQQKIWSMNLDGTDRVQISQGDTFETGGCYSRDGRYVFYMSTRDGGFDIYRFDLAKRVELRLTDAMGDDGEAEVSPDNQWVYFTTGRNRKPQIARMRLDGSEETVFTHTTGTWAKFRPISAPSQPVR